MGVTVMIVLLRWSVVTTARSRTGQALAATSESWALDRCDDLGGLRVGPRRNRAATVPSGLIRNFSKFHWTSPASPSASGGLRQLGVQRVPVVAVHLDLVEHREGHAVRRRAERRRSPPRYPAPARRTGCTGTPSTVNPRAAYVSCSFSRPSYCGVRPHLRRHVDDEDGLALVLTERGRRTGQGGQRDVVQAHAVPWEVGSCGQEVDSCAPTRAPRRSAWWKAGIGLSKA